MAKQKNIKTREYILNVAYALFAKQGYEKTTYLEIADASNNTRTRVQYYFPKKEFLAISFFEKLLDESAAYLSQNKKNTGNTFADLYLVGQIFYNFLLNTKNLKQFTLDIISSRALTEEILSFDEKWALDYMNINASTVSEEFSDEVCLGTGGFYELLYRNLKHNKKIDVAKQLGIVIVNLMVRMGYDSNDAKCILSKYELMAPDLVTANEYLLFKIFNT